MRDVPAVYTLLNKKIKFSSFIRIFRWDRVQSYVLLTASLYIVNYLRIPAYIRKLFLIYDFAPDPILTSLYMRKNFTVFFIRVKYVKPLQVATKRCSGFDSSGEKRN